MCHLKVRLGSSRLPNLASACSVSLSRNTFEEQLGLHGQGCPLGGRRQGRTGSGPACNLRLMVVTPLIRLEHLDSRQENERRQTQEKQAMPARSIQLAFHILLPNVLLPTEQASVL